MISDALVANHFSGGRVAELIYLGDLPIGQGLPKVVKKTKRFFGLGECCRKGRGWGAR